MLPAHTPPAPIKGGQCFQGNAAVSNTETVFIAIYCHSTVAYAILMCCVCLVAHYCLSSAVFVCKYVFFPRKMTFCPGVGMKKPHEKPRQGNKMVLYTLLGHLDMQFCLKISFHAKYMSI